MKRLIFFIAVLLVSIVGTRAQMTLPYVYDNSHRSSVTKKHTNPTTAKKSSKSTSRQSHIAQSPEGTWYITRENNVSFRADGTTDYGGLNRKYQYLADEGQIIVLNAYGSIEVILTVLKMTSDQLILSADGTTFVTYNKQRPPQPVKGISLNQTSIKMRRNSKAEIVASIVPADADNLNVIWTSSNNNIATVKNGRINAVGYGKATITAKSAENSQIYASCEVEVIGQVTSIKLSKHSIVLKANEFKQLEVSFFPANADNPKIHWSSSNEKVAQVTPQGRVLAMGDGLATITAKALDGSGVYSECAVAVGENIVPFNVNGTINAYALNGIIFKMVQVEGGTFTMGATSEQENDANIYEKPVHEVTLSSYYIGQTEVTQALWQAVMGSNPSAFKGGNRPVECVSWDDCQTFISKLNAITGMHFRLPTEAEWEFAARGGNNSRGYKYSGSKNLSDVAWYRDNSGSTTHDVATKQANELGLYDMNGNVWEWCSDWYGSYSSSSQMNPTGPNSGRGRVLRGGCWYGVAEYCHLSIRDNYGPGFSDYGLGLRLCLSE